MTVELDVAKIQVRELAKRSQEQETRAVALEAEVQRLKARLAFYENPNTPPSQRTLKPKPLREKGPPKKRGAPVGHDGATRVLPPPDETVAVTSPECPKCHQHPGSPVGTLSRTVAELPPPQAIRITRYELAQYECASCGHPFSARHPDCPRTGMWGPNLLAYQALLKYELRGSLRRVAEFLRQREGLDVTPKAVLDALRRVADACRTAYGNRLEALRRARFLYADETTVKVNGDERWLWNFRDPDGNVTTVIRDSRGRDVLREVLGDNPPPLVVDGHAPYKYASELQRCWAHLLRVADEETSQDGKALAAQIHDLFQRLKGVLAAGPPMDERRRHKDAFDAEVAALIQAYAAKPDAKKTTTYLQNGHPWWFTCLLHPGMEPTNNLAEQSLREHVIVRKLIGSFRSESGAQHYQYIASLMVSWRLQGKNAFEELLTLLRRDLCLK
ncbi:MAG: IS66 family transposase [Halobacteriales archaeon]|nr:IS66 family transposase [Halobacteriales archaeon]